MAPNALSAALARLRERGVPLIDLTVTNPTVVGIEYPAGLLDALSDGRGAAYSPEPAGMRTVREHVAEAVGGLTGCAPSPDDLLLTASTSEAYAVLFKLLCDAGDTVLVPQPSYPLFEHLAALEGVAVAPYRLAPHWNWSVDFDSLDAAWTERARAVVVVSPNNPTGSVVSEDDRRRLLEWCDRHELALVVDEVFRWYPLASPRPADGDIPFLSQGRARADDDLPGARGEALAPPNGGVRSFLGKEEVPGLVFALDGLSKSCGLPQLKLAWIQVAGEPALVADARRRLEVILDTYLSVSTPVQVAFPRLWDASAPVRRAIQSRVQENLAIARGIVNGDGGCSLVLPEAGWSLVLRVPAIEPEETRALGLLEREGVIVHPGYFFDFPHEAYLVASLLPRRGDFVEGLSRVVGRCRIA